MTLVVYKNGVLAADTRSTKRCFEHGDDCCAHCGKKATAVNNDRQKIHTPNPRQKPVFRGDKVLAVAAAGETKLIDRMTRLVLRGQNIEEVYEHYLAVHGSYEDRPSTCTLILIGENKNYTVQVPKKGKLNIDEVEKTEIINIGSGAHSSVWINRLLKKLPAQAVVNLAMYEDISVGGEIDFIDFSKPEPKIERAEKMDPDALLNQFQEIIALGFVTRANNNQQKKAPARKAPARKPAAKRAPTKKV